MGGRIPIPMAICEPKKKVKVLPIRRDGIVIGYMIHCPGCGNDMVFRPTEKVAPNCLSMGM